MVVRKGVKQDFVEHDTSFYCSILVVKGNPLLVTDTLVYLPQFQ